MADYREAFPDFDPTTMPQIPAGFVDQSWRNDTMPSFRCAAALLTMWIDYADPELREIREGGRFSLMRDKEDETHPEFLMESDSLDEIVAGALGEAFVGVLREWLTPDEMARVREQNAADAEAGVGGLTCHSHDFCDANEAMLVAFQRVFGREMALGEDTPEMAAAQEADMALANAAWGYAKRSGGLR